MAPRRARGLFFKAFHASNKMLFDGLEDASFVYVREKVCSLDGSGHVSVIVFLCLYEKGQLQCQACVITWIDLVEPEFPGFY